MSLIQQKHFHFHLRRPQIFLVQDWARFWWSFCYLCTILYKFYQYFTAPYRPKRTQNIIYITGVGRDHAHLIVNYRKEEIATRQSEVQNTMENSIFYGLSGDTVVMDGENGDRSKYWIFELIRLFSFRSKYKCTVYKGVTRGALFISRWVIKV